MNSDKTQHAFACCERPKFSIFSRSYLRSESGATPFIEFAIALPFLVTMFASIVDLGYALNQHLLLTQIANEGVKLASAVQMGEVDVTYRGLTAGQGGNCDAQGTTDREAHRIVQQRIISLINQYNLHIVPNSVCVRTGLLDNTFSVAGTPETHSDVFVRIEAAYDNFVPTPGLSGIQIEAEARAPHL